MRSAVSSGSRWAEYRSHGDPFPLSPSWLNQLVEDAGLQFPQRGKWLANSLNTLALQATNSDFDQKLQGVAPNCPQVAVAQRVIDTLREAGNQPDDMSGADILRDMGLSNDLYNEEPANLASYSYERVKVLQTDLNPRPLTSVLPEHTKALLKRSESFIERETSDISKDEPCGVQPYWDPRLRRSTGELRRLLVRLANQGLVSFRSRIRERVGIFFVKKKSPEWIRMIVDARRVNHLHRDPPVARLATPRSYLDLQVPRSENHHLGFGIEADVNDCFYNFTNDQTASFFGIDYPMTVAEWAEAGWVKTSLYSDDIGDFFMPDDSLVVYPVFRGLCMGWSWALFLAQQAVSHIAAGQIQRPLREIRDKQPLPSLTDGPLVGVYVDNISIIGLEKAEVIEAANRVEKYFKDTHIPLTWSSSEPQEVFSTVGIIIDFKNRSIRNKPSRLWRAFLAGREILRRGRISVKLLEKWLGYMTSIFMLSPSGLSCFFHIYRFVAENRGKRAFMWNTVRHEIRLALGVMWMSRSSIGFNPVRQIDVGDSSSTAYALLTTWASPQEICECIRWRETWRFSPAPEIVKEVVKRGDREELIRLLEHIQSGDDHPDVPLEIRPGLPWGAGLATQYAHWLLSTEEPGSWLRTSAVRAQLRARGKRRTEVDIPALVPPVDAALCERKRYSLLWRKRWRCDASHINVKEARVAVSSLKRTVRTVSLHGMTKLTLCDNLAGLCALERGRSSSFALNKVCRAAAAYQLCSGVRWRLRHVETLRNPADFDSRFDKPKSVAAPTGFLGKRLQPLSVNAEWHNDEVPGIDPGAGHCVSSSSSARVILPRRAHGCFLEIFAGSCRLTNAVKAEGLAVGPPIDIDLGSECDMRRRSSQRLILSWIRSGHLSYVHLGTPCTVFSRARHWIRNHERARERERVGLELAWFTAEVIAWCKRYNVNWSIENPRSSRLFQLPFLAEILEQGHVIDLDFCMYGEAYRKPTRIVSSLGSLSQLSRQCSHKKHSVTLRGSERVVVNGKTVSQPKTKRAGAYPSNLVEQWAQVIRGVVSQEDRESHAIFAQLTNELRLCAEKAATAGRKPIQSDDDRDVHFQQIKKFIPEPQKVFLFGQDSNAEGESKRRIWEKVKKKVDKPFLARFGDPSEPTKTLAFEGIESQRSHFEEV